MSLFSHFNKQVFRVFLQVEGWLLLIALLPAAVYGYTDSIWMGTKVFLAISLVATLGLLWAFWGALFPKDAGDS